MNHALVQVCALLNLVVWRSLYLEVATQKRRRPGLPGRGGRLRGGGRAELVRDERRDNKDEEDCGDAKQGEKAVVLVGLGPDGAFFRLHGRKSRLADAFAAVVVPVRDDLRAPRSKLARKEQGDAGALALYETVSPLTSTNSWTKGSISPRGLSVVLYRRLLGRPPEPSKYAQTYGRRARFAFKWIPRGAADAARAPRTGARSSRRSPTSPSGARRG